MADSGMTRRERVRRALEHRATDYVPYHIGLTGQAENNLAALTGKHGYLNDQGMHMHLFQYGGWPTETAPGSERFRDDFGVLWNRTGVDKDIGVIEDLVIPADEPDVSFFRPKLDEARIRREMEHLMSTADDKFVVAGVGFSLFERLWSLQGMENALANFLLEPKFTEELLDAICEYDLRVLEIELEYPVDAVYFGDDWGGQRGLIMGREHWSRFLAPRLKKLYGMAKSKGKFVIQHSCGDIHEVFGDLIDMGLDCYQTFQPEIYDVERIKREFGRDLSFWGGVSTQRLLPFATPEKVKEETKRLIDLLGRENGGYIAAPTHDVPGDVPAQNILAMLDAMQHQG